MIDKEASDEFLNGVVIQWSKQNAVWLVICHITCFVFAAFIHNYRPSRLLMKVE